MKAHVVFIHAQQPRAALRIDHDNYVVVQSKCRTDLSHTDEISGDLTLANVKWLLNLTHSKLVRIKVLGRYTALETAVAAAMHTRRPPVREVPANLARHRNRGGRGAAIAAVAVPVPVPAHPTPTHPNDPPRAQPRTVPEGLAAPRAYPARLGHEERHLVHEVASG